MADNFFDQSLEPFKGFSMEGLYLEHGPLIDFIIYLFIFVTIAKIALANRFEGRQANMLAGALGTALAVSLALTERKFGFGLRSFGPIAAFVIILFVGFILYMVVHHIGGGRAGSGAIAFVIVYFLMRAVSPILFNWLEEKAPFIHGVLGIAVIIAIWQAFSSFVHLKNPSLKNVWVRQPASAPESGLTVQELTTEKRLIRGRLEKITRRERKQSREIIADLKETINIVDEHGNTLHGRNLIAQKLQDIAPREHDILNKLTYLKNLDQWLKKFDFRQLKELREKYTGASKKGKELVRKEILEQRQKLNIEEEIENIDYEVKKYQEDFRHYLNMAINYLNATGFEEAKKWLYKAMDCEKGAASLFKKMKRFEDMLLRLTKIEVKLEAEK